METRVQQLAISLYEAERIFEGDWTLQTKVPQGITFPSTVPCNALNCSIETTTKKYAKSNLSHKGESFHLNLYSWLFFYIIQTIYYEYMNNIMYKETIGFTCCHKLQDLDNVQFEPAYTIVVFVNKNMGLFVLIVIMHYA